MLVSKKSIGSGVTHSRVTSSPVSSGLRPVERSSMAKFCSWRRRFTKRVSSIHDRPSSQDQDDRLAARCAGSWPSSCARAVL
eukprot:scaffold7942_cov59-Phaeocystis_antarctica.AAC.2